MQNNGGTYRSAVKERGEDAQPKTSARRYTSAAGLAAPLVHGAQDGVLAPEAGEGHHARQGQRSEPERGSAWSGMRRRKPLKRRMSITLPMACITLPAPRNSRALKKACVNKWNMPAGDARERCRLPSAQEHVAQLTDRRVGQHAFQIVLRQGDGRRQYAP